MHFDRYWQHKQEHMSPNLDLKLLSFSITPFPITHIYGPWFNFCIKNFHTLSNISLHASFPADTVSLCCSLLLLRCGGYGFDFPRGATTPASTASRVNPE